MASLTTRIAQALQKEFVEGTIYRIDLDRVDVAPNGSAGIMRSLPLTGNRDKIKPGDPVKIITVGGQRVALVGDVAFSDGEAAQVEDASEIELMESLQGYAKGEIVAQGATDSSVATTTGFTNTQARDSFTATAGQTSYTLATTPVGGTVLVYWNGILQKYSTDYSVSGATLTTLFSPGAGDIIDAVYNTPTNILVNADMAVDDLSGQVPAQTFNTTYKFVGKSLAVYINGILQEPAIVTFGTDQKSFTLSSARNIVAGDKVLAVYPKGSGFSVADADTLDGKHAAAFYLKTDKVANAVQADSATTATTAANVGGYTPATSGANAHVPITDGNGNLTINGKLLGTTGIGARIYSSVNVSIPNNAWATQVFNTVLVDSVPAGVAGHWDGVNTTRLWCRVTGWHVITANVALYTNGSGDRGIRILINGSEFAMNIQRVVSGGYSHPLNIATLYYLNAGDYVEMSVFQNSGAALNSAPLPYHSPQLAIARLP